MTTSELISYINKQIQNNVSKDLIISKLIGVGWHREDIDEGFSAIAIEKLEPAPTVATPPVKEEIVDLDGVDSVESIKNVGNVQNPMDKYREPVTVDNILETESSIEVKPTEVGNINEIKELPKVEIPKKEPKIIELSKVETPKVWIPFQAPIKEKSQVDEVKKEEVKPKTTQVEIQNLELETKKSARNADSIASTGGEELIPILKTKLEQNPFGYVKVNYPTPPSNDPNVNNQNEAPKISSGKDLPRMAMISSYQKDMISMSQSNKAMIKKNNNFKILKWGIIGFVITALVGLGIFAFLSGYIKIPNLDFLSFSFIKKDPKVLLLKNSEVLSSLSSYKTETNIEISSPSLSTIFYGPVSGEAVPRDEDDSMSVNVLGQINKNESGLLSDNSITVKSSILTNDINSNIKSNGSDLFITISDFSQILKEDITLASAIILNQQQFDLIPPLFPLRVEKKLKKINIYKVLSTGVSSYMNEDILTSYNELINNVEVIQKGEENIKGVDTYHYSINADRQLAEDLLVKLADNFLMNLSEEDKDTIGVILGDVRIDSFEVWVGKGDSNIYQYSVAVNVPISKIVGFEDKSIENIKVDISWQMTYYDFNVPNEIIIPENSIPVTEFVGSVNDLRIKKNVLYFIEAADNLYSIEKSYGTKSNTKGSCMEPVSGSLFSPTGHIKKAEAGVNLISWHLKDIMKVTDSNSSCYSTTKAWSFAFLLSTPSTSLEGTENKTFFCVDSEGNNQTLTSLPTGVSCLSAVISQ